MRRLTRSTLAALLFLLRRDSDHPDVPSDADLDELRR